MKKPTFTTAFTREPKTIRDVSCVEFTAPNKVKRSLSYATDINTIYRQYTATGKLPLNNAQPIYDENFINYDSLIHAQKTVDEAVKYFSTLPAEIKNNYGNDLSKFILAVNNKDEFLIKSGLLQLPNAKPLDVEVKTDDIVNPTPETPVVEPVNTAQTD